MQRSLTLVLVLVFVLAGCGPSGEPDAPDDAPPPAPPAAPTATTPPSTPTTAPPPAPDPVDASLWQSEFDPLPAEPVAVTIPTADGRTLSGMYYPAKVNPAPIVVMMHWAGGDQYDWWQLAPWLQNRADEYTPGPWPGGGINGPWLDPTWFPPVLPEASFGVLVFDFSGFGSSPSGGEIPEDWLEDALAAVRFAATLEGADPARVLALGGSIGADGALDGCVLFNREPLEGAMCIGALSLSPSAYLKAPFTYAEGAEEMAAAGYPVYCLSAEGGLACLDPSHENYFPFIYEGDDHAMFLIQPDLAPATPEGASPTLELLLEWLALATGLPTHP